MSETDPTPAHAGDEPEAGPLAPLLGAAASEVVSELPKKAADAIARLVDLVHDKGVRPAVLATRVVVFGVLVAALSVVVLVLGSVAVLRLFDVYVFGRTVFLSYIVLGGALTLLGLAIWTRRSTRTSRARSH